MKRHKVILCLSSLTLLLFILIGCGKNELIIDSSTTVGGSGPAAYFPLSNGYTTRFQITTSSGNHWTEDFTISGSAIIQNMITTMRRKESQSGNDTGYFRATTSALYYFATPTSQGEKILELPLTIGNTWERFSLNTGIDTGGTNPDTTGGGTGGTGGNGSNSPSHFPSTGSNTMEVTNIQTITLGNGLVFSGAVQVCTDAGNGLQNQYWFAPGVGLVKYVLGAPGYLSTASGQEVGELLDYWR